MVRERIKRERERERRLAPFIILDHRLSILSRERERGREREMKRGEEGRGKERELSALCAQSTVSRRGKRERELLAFYAESAGTVTARGREREIGGGGGGGGGGRGREREREMRSRQDQIASNWIGASFAPFH